MLLACLITNIPVTLICAGVVREEKQSGKGGEVNVIGYPVYGKWNKGTRRNRRGRAHNEAFDVQFIMSGHISGEVVQ